MRRSFKKVLSICMALSMLTIGGKVAFAQNVNTTTNVNDTLDMVNILNKSSVLSNERANALVEDLQLKLINQYQGNFKLENFHAIFVDVENDKNFVDVDITADMTLISDPTDTSYVHGMKIAIESIQNPDDKALAQQELDEYLTEQLSYYNVPDETTFCYRINIPEVATLKDEVENYEMFYRTDITEDEVNVTPVPSNPQYESIGLGDEQDGKEVIVEAIRESKNRDLTKAVTYSKTKAIKYAKDNATSEPEFSDKNKMGSDCANFVSKCMNAGGIPVDKAGDWSPSPKAGEYAAVNWMRTGYNLDSNGKYTGVKTYMLKKKYFAKTTAKNVAGGGFMFWNTTSHVALVTSNAKGVIKYSQHSNVKQTQVTKTYGSEDVTFYNPT